MRHMLRSASLRDVKVGTVDDYQGQEGKVIFVSTTVSRRYGFTDLSQDSTAVSFIGSPQRFNVAVSRAQHMLVVVMEGGGEGVEVVLRSVWGLRDVAVVAQRVMGLKRDCVKVCA